MFGWWRKDGPESSNTEPLPPSDGTLNSKLPLTSSGEVHPSSGEVHPSSGEVHPSSGEDHPSSAEFPKTVRQRNQRSAVLGTSKVTTEPTTAPATECASAEEPVEEEIGRLLDLNWNWVSPKPPQSFEQDVVRVWSSNAPPARRQPTAREHAIELFQLLQHQPRFVAKWILATDLQNVVYPHFLASLGWAPRPWVGRNGVAKHLGELTLRSCKRVEVAGLTRNWTAFFVPGKTQQRARCRELGEAPPVRPLLRA